MAIFNSYVNLPEGIDDWPIEHGDFPVRYAENYQRTPIVRTTYVA